MRKNGTLNFIIGDHLGSTSLVTDSSGVVINQTQYKAWGEERYSSGVKQTGYGYTGQYSYAADFGLHFYNARWYDSSLGRFNQPDTIIPPSQGVQAWDRYAYTNNNPLRYTDPTGHWLETAFDVVSLGLTVNDIRKEGFTAWNVVSLVTDVAAIALPVVPAGASHLIRAAKYTSKAVNAADTAGDTAKVVDKTYTVYRSIVDGVTEYVGMTTNLKRRTREHFNAGRIIEDIPGLSNLSKYDAKSVEQALIDKFKLKKDGGLSNVINSISPKRGSYYKNALKHGQDLLDSRVSRWTKWRNR